MAGHCLLDHITHPSRPLLHFQFVCSLPVHIQVGRHLQAVFVDWAALLPPLANAPGEMPKSMSSSRWARTLQLDFKPTHAEFVSMDSVLNPDQEDSRSTNPSTATTRLFFHIVIIVESCRKNQLITAWTARMGAVIFPSTLENVAI